MFIAQLDRINEQEILFVTSKGLTP